MDTLQHGVLVKKRQLFNTVAFIVNKLLQNTINYYIYQNSHESIVVVHLLLDVWLIEILMYIHIVSSHYIESKYNFFYTTSAAVYSFMAFVENKVDRLVKTFQGALQR